ncbi:hypothetical protein QZH41_000398, partial [Actinostola sp. cb2023]
MHFHLVTQEQDNAGCYHSSPTIVGASFEDQFHGVSVKRMDFSDPQGGKGSCDRKAASIKSHMRVYLNEGNNIETASEVVKAIQSSGGVRGVNVTLSDTVASKDNSAFSAVKLDGVSLISNIEYNGDSVRLWRAYGVGAGKSISKAKDLGLAKGLKVPDLVTFDSVTESDVQEFVTSKSKQNHCEEIAAKSTCPSNVEDNSDDNPNYLLFPCPEEGCVKTYQRFSALQLHMDCGKHQRSLEKETLYDKARTLPDEMTDLDNVKETNAAEKESAFNDLGNQIMEDVALVHPIFYDSYNLCELIASLKLAKFSIQMLQNICEYFDIPSQDIKSRRKAPYIERIVAFETTGAEASDSSFGLAPLVSRSRLSSFGLGYFPRRVASAHYEAILTDT